MFSKFLKILIIIGFLFSITVGVPVKAELDDDLKNTQSQMEENKKEQDRLKQAIADAKNQEKTLANQLAYLNNQIELTELQIEETQAEYLAKQDELDNLLDNLTNLAQKIEKTQSAIDKLTTAFTARIRDSYKTSQSSKLTSSLPMLLSTSNNLQDVVLRFKYLKVVEQHDQQLLGQLEDTKKTFNEEKANLETKKQELEELKDELSQEKQRLEEQSNTLAAQKSSKDYLMKVTKNDEATYQQMLTQAIEEQKAISDQINSILKDIISQLGEGQLPKGVPVKQGDVIGFQGHSGYEACKAFGSHLHFAVYDERSGVNYISGLNPANYLGSLLRWPLGDPLITSGYGWRDSGFHDAYDMIDRSYGLPSSETYSFCGCGRGCQEYSLWGEGAPVYAVADGTIIFSGASRDGSGNAVIIYHPGLKLFTIYWHLR